jgi:hypothetical protein
MITGANGHGILYAAPAFRDFELTLLVRSHNRVNAGIFLRGSPHPKGRIGLQIHLADASADFRDIRVRPL